MTASERAALLAALHDYHEARTTGAADQADREERLRQVLGTIALRDVAAGLDELGTAFIESVAEATAPTGADTEARRDFELLLLTGTTDPIAAAVVAGRQAVRMARKAGIPDDVVRTATLDHCAARFAALGKGACAAMVAVVAEGIDQELAAR